MATSDLIFIESIYLPKIWGGKRLRDPSATTAEPIGERLLISAHPDGDCVVRRGPHAGKPLSWLWSTHPDLFGGHQGGRFPLQVKLIDAGEDLSVQVHPGAQHASAMETDGAKSECWYVLEPSRSGQIVIGHKADSREELKSMAESGRWDDLLQSRDSHSGDFYFIQAGTVHCILAGALIYEVMQSSNTTFRFHDHNRRDENGDPRDLHFEEAMTVITVPHAETAVEPVISRTGDVVVTVFVDEDCFRVRRFEIGGVAHLTRDAPYLLVSVVEGAGTINGTAVTPEDHFIVPSTVEGIDVHGHLVLMVADVHAQN